MFLTNPLRRSQLRTENRIERIKPTETLTDHELSEVDILIFGISGIILPRNAESHGAGAIITN
jgi:hypothetical protein